LLPLVRWTTIVRAGQTSFGQTAPMHSVKSLLLIALTLAATLTSRAAEPTRPNIVLIMTDDQGWGDLGIHGNKQLKTPNLDAFARQSVALKNFYVSPVCTPTRASLMTGRYNYRTGAIDTFRGRALMHADEVTLAEMLAAGGYRTGIFGKWHLGDNYPLRARDQGFQESLTIWGGGLVQWADPPKANGNSYFNPWLSHNGTEKQFPGYCSDIYTDAAIEYIARHRENPFFVYLAFNAPHTPLEVRESDHQPYQQMGLDETTAKVYGMVTNIDANIGRLLKKLDELSLTEDTIVIFLTDNGPQQRRYNGVWRGLKGSVYEGGIHVPCFVRWPRRLTAGHSVEQPAAHIDIAPTLLAACGVAAPGGVKFNGRDLLPLVEDRAADWMDRNLFFQWHRGDVPQLHRAFAVRGPRYKLVQATGAGEQAPPKEKFELFDLTSDPGEKNDLAADQPEIVAKMKSAYEAWFRDVSATRGYDPPAIHIGTDNENPLRLSRQDLRGFGPREPGYWRVKIERGSYRVRLLFAASAATGQQGAKKKSPASDDEKLVRRAIFVCGAEKHVRDVPNGQAEVSFESLILSPDAPQIQAWVDANGAIDEVRYVELHRIASGT
jgi:arylsulfatase A-like enzyme